MTIRTFDAFTPQLLAMAVALAVSAQAQAIDFNIGGRQLGSSRSGFEIHLQLQLGGRAAKSSGAMFLDSFVYHNYTLDDLAGNVRLGKQVVSWGESTFISNGINAINPVDVA